MKKWAIGSAFILGLTLLFVLQIKFSSYDSKDADNSLGRAIANYDYINHEYSTTELEDVEVDIPDSIDSKKMDPLRMKLNDAILKVKTKDDIKNLAKAIIAWDQKYNFRNGQLDVKRPQLRLYAIFAKIVPYLEGGIYRMRNITDTNTILYSSAMTALREIHYNLDLLPSYHKAIFDYLTSPNPEQDIWGQKGPFKNMRALQDFIVSKGEKRLVDLMEEVSTNLEDLLKNLNNDDRIITVTDSRFLIPDGHFLKVKELRGSLSEWSHGTNDPIIYTKVVRAGHLRALMAMIQHGIGTGYYGASFDFDGFSEYTNLIAKRLFYTRTSEWLKSLFDHQDITDSNNIPSPKERTQFIAEVRKSFPSFLKLRKDVHFLNQSKEAFLTSVDQDMLFHQYVFSRAGSIDGKQDIADAQFLDDHKHGPVEILKIRFEQLSGKTDYKIQNFVTTEKFEFHLEKMFDPNVVEDFYLLMPTTFDSSPEVFRGDQRGKDYFRWNYNYGKPTGWKDLSMGGIFPGTKTERELRERIFTVMQHPSFSFIAPIMTFFK